MLPVHILRLVNFFFQLTLEQLIRHKLSDGRKVIIFTSSAVVIYNPNFFKHMDAIVDLFFS